MGPPGTSKTYHPQQLGLRLTNKKSENIRIIQFHPSYSYEDFVECKEVTSGEHNSLIKFVPKPKIFRKICELALKSKNNNSKEKFILIIDEIYS